MGEIGAHVEGRVRGDDLALLVLPAVDEGGDLGQLGHDVAGILVHRIPVVVLLHVVVLGGELALLLQGQHGRGQHRHGMCVLGHGLEHVAGLESRFIRRRMLDDPADQHSALAPRLPP